MALKFNGVAASLLAAGFSSCASPITVDSIPVYGRLGLLSPAEIHAAVVADRSSRSEPTDRIYAIEIVSKTEVHIHHSPWRPNMFEYDEIHWIKGKWQKAPDRIVGGRSPI
jgi:hypothetical protein